MLPAEERARERGADIAGGADDRERTMALTVAFALGADFEDAADADGNGERVAGGELQAGRRLQREAVAADDAGMRAQGEDFAAVLRRELDAFWMRRIKRSRLPLRFISSIAAVSAPMRMK